MSPTRRISSRIAGIAESATLAVDAKAKALRAAGEPIIGFGAGEPDFPTPDHVVEAAVAAARDPRNHGYSPAAGLPELREAIAAQAGPGAGYEVTAEQVLVTNGGKHAIFAALATLLDPGDEVLLPAPCWTTYPEAVRLTGGEPVVLPTDESTGFKVTVEQLEAACTPRTRLLVFVSPGNPSGMVYTPDEVAAIGRWAAGRGLWVVTDEIYRHLTYGDHRFSSILTAVPDLADRCVVVDGVAKTFAMTGWRVGWVIGPADVVRAATNLQSHTTSNVANVSQRAALAALTGGLEPVTAMREAFDRRRRVMYERLSALPDAAVLEPQGAFYAFPDLSGYLHRPIRGRKAATTVDLCDILLEEAQVAMVPGEAFHAPGHARLSFALGDDDLAEGCRRIVDHLAGAE